MLILDIHAFQDIFEAYGQDRDHTTQDKEKDLVHRFEYQRSSPTRKGQDSFVGLRSTVVRLGLEDGRIIALHLVAQCCKSNV